MRSDHQVEDTFELPATYREHRAVDFKKDRKFAVTVQAVFAGVALAAVGVALGLDFALESSWPTVGTIAITLLGCLIYMAAHEATHGLVLGLMTKIRPIYAVRFPFLTTGTPAFLTRRSAAIVALAPSVIWGMLLIIGLVTLPQDFRLTAFVLLALNFAGSAGDFVEVVLVTRLQPDALIQDDGKKIRFFLPQG